MNKQIAEVRSILRNAVRKNAHHQIASRRLAAAEKFAEADPVFAAQMLAEARYEAQYVEAA